MAGRPIRHFPPEITREILADYRLGLSQRILAQAYHTSEQAIARLLTQAKATLRTARGRVPRTLTAARERALIRAYQAGKGMIKLGREYHIHASRVRAILVRHGVTLHPLGNPTKAALSAQDYHKRYYLTRTKPRRAAKRKAQ